jgi:hypothetical protein
VAIAEGNTLGKGPVVFHLPQRLIGTLQGLAQEDGGMAALRLELLRMSAAYVVESMEADVTAAVARHMLDVATVADGNTRERPSLLRHSQSANVASYLAGAADHLPEDGTRKPRGSGFTPIGM